MGCCGRGFGSEKEIEQAIRRNTVEFKEANPGNREEYLSFRRRAHPEHLRDGVCRNLIEIKGRIFCPLHPELHNGEDLRKGHCDIDYLCETAKEFKSWDEARKKQFLQLVKEKKLDNLAYSILMDNNSLLKEFTEKII